MQIEREGSSEAEIRRYENLRDMMEDAIRVSKEKGVKKITLHFPKLTIPKKRGRRRTP